MLRCVKLVQRLMNFLERSVLCQLSLPPRERQKELIYEDLSQLNTTLMLFFFIFFFGVLEILRWRGQTSTGSSKQSICT